MPAGLADPETVSFSTSGVPVLRSQQLLAELGYPPRQLHPPVRPTGAGQRTDQRSRGQPVGAARHLRVAFLQYPVVPVLSVDARPGQRRDWRVR